MNAWKLAALGTVALGATSLTSVLTTAALLRAPAEPPVHVVAATQVADVAPVRSARALVQATPRHSGALQARPTATVSAAPVVPPPSAQNRVSAPAEAAAVAPPERPASTPSPEPVATSTAPTPAPGDCATGGERALRIAKPGAIGALLGAGLGAAGGALANGGKAAGQGAVIGGLAGAALGTGYGAYTTKTECGTIFGDAAREPGNGGRRAPASGIDRAPAGFTADGNASTGAITIYRAR